MEKTRKAAKKKNPGREEKIKARISNGEKVKCRLKIIRPDNNGIALLVTVEKKVCVRITSKICAARINEFLRNDFDGEFHPLRGEHEIHFSKEGVKPVNFEGTVQVI